jgi:hypothetical protein
MKFSSVLGCIDMKTSFPSLFATHIVDHPADPSDLIDPQKIEFWMRLIFAHQSNRSNTQDSINDTLSIGNIIDVDHINAIGSSGQDPLGVNKSLRG